MILNCNGLLLDLSSPKIMAILNVTPDSFYDGNNYANEEALKAQIDTLISEGAHIIDIGGMSSRPGAQIVPPEEEWRRIQFSIKYILDNYPTMIISIDTIHSEIAARALDYGVHMINDISGGNYDNDMYATVGHSNAAYIAMHMQGTPQDMQSHTEYEDGLMLHLMEYFKNIITKTEKSGIKDVVLDPGFGFSKTLEQNYELMNHFGNLRIFEKAIMVGISRKSMIYKTLGSSPKEALNGTTALHMKALLSGANLLRVHDVKEAIETLKLFELLSVQGLSSKK